MTRSIDLDKVAPDDVIEVKKEETENEKAEIQTNTSKTKTLKEKIYEIVGHTKHSLSSVLVNPDVFSFEERDTQEEILLVARPHWFTNLSWILISILMLLAPGFIKFIPIINSIPMKYIGLGTLVWYLLTFAIIFENFLSWYFDVFIITDKRVIDIDFNNLLDKKFSEAKLSMIQDVTSRVSGLGQTMFNYGTIHIQTAAEVSYITFEKVPHPEKIIKILQFLREKKEIDKGGRN
ncbi:MAG: PH domain-containing protein [Candidatus Shapirobacteria bacterium]|jgi:hypothetical protein|nr:PH domain-containing protein [Candidatus Shapirobacteria bacterium]